MLNVSNVLLFPARMFVRLRYQSNETKIGFFILHPNPTIDARARSLFYIGENAADKDQMYIRCIVHLARLETGKEK